MTLNALGLILFIYIEDGKKEAPEQKNLKSKHCNKANISKDFKGIASIYYEHLCPSARKKIHGVAVNLPKHTGHMVI